MTALRRALVAPSVLFVFVFGFAQAPAFSQESSQDGLALLHRMQTALGGAERIAAIHDYEETVCAKVWNKSGIPEGKVCKRTRWMRSPNLLRLDQRGPRDTYVLYFDGGSGSGWEMLPDVKGPDKFKTTGDSIELVGGELKFAQKTETSGPGSEASRFRPGSTPPLAATFGCGL